MRPPPEMPSSTGSRFAARHSPGHAAFTLSSAPFSANRAVVFSETHYWRFFRASARRLRGRFEARASAMIMATTKARTRVNSISARSFRLRCPQSASPARQRRLAAAARAEDEPLRRGRPRAHATPAREIDIGCRRSLWRSPNTRQARRAVIRQPPCRNCAWLIRRRGGVGVSSHYFSLSMPIRSSLSIGARPASHRSGATSRASRLRRHGFSRSCQEEARAFITRPVSHGR